MGKIFGISDLPVSTIETALKGVTHEAPKVFSEAGGKVDALSKNFNACDEFVAQNKKVVSNPFVKARNGIGKLMQSFSKVEKKS